MPPRSVYVHVPFCRHRCGYCDFTLVAGRDDLIARYLDALFLEIERADLTTSRLAIDTMFVGGGTPTHLPLESLEHFFSVLHGRFGLGFGSNYPEFSIEANPLDCLDEAKAMELHIASVSRVSLGVQSFNHTHLKTLERDHTAYQIAEAAEMLRTSATGDLSLDLIFAIPGQTLADWEADLDAVIALNPEHVSTYGLTIEKGTTFYGRRAKGELVESPDELQREMYLLAVEKLNAAGIVQYEISNFARPGHECRHNLNYWRGGEYLAFGPGAARLVDGVRATNHRGVLQYLKLVEAGCDPTTERDVLDDDTRAREAIWLGLRLVEGIDVDQFATRFGRPPSDLAGEAAYDGLLADGLIDDAGGRLRLTGEGRILADGVAEAFF
ncbi:MAG: radical SAM family heme chaperone HemW [Planctomycetota bacterium]